MTLTVMRMMPTKLHSWSFCHYYSPSSPASESNRLVFFGCNCLPFHSHLSFSKETGKIPLTRINYSMLSPVLIEAPPPPPPSCSFVTCALGGGDDLSSLPLSMDDEEEEARLVISEILQDCGVSEDDSREIVIKAPRYIRMLVDSVHELNELSLWGSWKSEKQSTTSDMEEGVGTSSSSSPDLVPFREKVEYVAKQKGEKGMFLPWLESLGLSLSSATYIARYLSSETLPNLICKVKYMKEIFSYDSDDKRNTSKKARQMMQHLSIPIDEDVQQTLSFFEKIEARRGGLDMMVSEAVSFRYLIESFPRLLLLSVDSHMKPLVEFLLYIGLSRGGIRDVFLLFPPIMFYDINKDVKLRMQTFGKVGASNRDFGRILLKYPWVLSLSIQGNYKEILSFFDLEKVPKTSVEQAIKSWPIFLGCSIRKLKLMVEEFGTLGVRDKKLGQVIATSPQLLLQKPQDFLQVISFLEELGLDEKDIGQILGRCPEIFATSIEKTLKKKLDFLLALGISRNHIPKVIRKYPELFVCDVNRTLHPRMKYLIKTGLSRKDIVFMVRGFSPLLGYNIDQVLKPKLEFLVNTMDKPLKDVVEYPRYFSYSLEKKIKPRYWVLKDRNIIEFSLKDMLGKNDEEFAVEFMGVREVSPLPNE
ncbi:uncharacterized protein LOC124936271 [Impatiens glandulifera]|uniref:uncharacterized protein LOC124936271 n=1 Tax=Impatiens glandulifera TaxID=253017 RepID=UPI001FB101D3|nr:uncharacterized protein LOC124936271 [Impatiens glandulifera]